MPPVGPRFAAMVIYLKARSVTLTRADLEAFDAKLSQVEGDDAFIALAQEFSGKLARAFMNKPALMSIADEFGPTLSRQAEPDPVDIGRLDIHG